MNDLVTARLAGASAGVNDIDGGVTSIRSPAITLPATRHADADVQPVPGSRLQRHERGLPARERRSARRPAWCSSASASATNVDGAWAAASANLTPFAGQTIRLLIEAADAGTASLVEAGIDDVRITQQ